MRTLYHSRYICAPLALWFYQNQSYCIGIADVPKNKIMSGKEFKEISGNVPLFKGFSNSMKQHDLQYKEGERAQMTDPKSFKSYDNCRGLHFTDGHSEKYYIWLYNVGRLQEPESRCGFEISYFNSRCNS
jgi:hypothetical protein